MLWVGDSPTTSTGFARCTRAACAALQAAGHEVHVVGISYDGDPHKYPYPIYVARKNERDRFGVRRVPELVDALKPDVVVILNDPWNVVDYYDALTVGRPDGQPPMVAWVAVDAKNHPASSQLNGLAHLVAWTKFAVEEMVMGGYTGSWGIVPLGCDTDVFYPRDKSEARQVLLPPETPKDAYVVGVVGRNQPRKRIDLALDYFSAWIDRYKIEDAHLHLHVSPTGEKACDIRFVKAYYPNLEGRVMAAAPQVGTFGYSDDDMANVYAAMDCYLTTTQGEGWGLTTHEAMACGVPCIVPDWSALGEWPGNAVLKVPCSHTALNAPLNHYPYTIGGVPDKEATIEALQELYRNAALRADLGARGMSLTADPRLRWASVGKAFASELEKVLSNRLVAA